MHAIIYVIKSFMHLEQNMVLFLEHSEDIVNLVQKLSRVCMGTNTFKPVGASSIKISIPSTVFLTSPVARGALANPSNRVIIFINANDTYRRTRIRKRQRRRQVAVIKYRARRMSRSRAPFREGYNYRFIIGVTVRRHVCQQTGQLTAQRHPRCNGTEAST